MTKAEFPFHAGGRVGGFALRAATSALGGAQSKRQLPYRDYEVTSKPRVPWKSVDLDMSPEKHEGLLDQRWTL